MKGPPLWLVLTSLVATYDAATGRMWWFAVMTFVFGMQIGVLIGHAAERIRRKEQRGEAHQ